SPGGVVRRLTAAQYATIIGDVFGPTIKIGGRFEPDLRADGLLEVGASRVSVSSTGFDLYDSMARSIAAQVVSEENRDIMFSCKPASQTAADDACAAKFFAKVGQALFRRPLSKDEVAAHVATAAKAATTLKDFYAGISFTLASMLEAPEFLFRIEDVQADRHGDYQLSAFAKATRLSFFLWNTRPDPMLLEAAAKGELDSKRGLERQVDRMLASLRLKDGVRAFFADMLRLDGMDDLAKDTVIYPKFNSQVASEAREQALRTIENVVLATKGDYRDIFTTRQTFMTAGLASIYQIPLGTYVPNGSPDYWRSYEFPADDPRAGILMQVSFVAMNSHPGRSSPTLRGKALREVMLCQKVPPPPGDVKFDIVQDTSNPVYRTARDRLTAHRSNPVCAGCHKLIDPMGLALENFDGAGGYRVKENGVAIDTSGELDGVKFANGAALGKVVHDNPAASSCLVDRMSAYALGRSAEKADEPWVDEMKREFAKVGYNVPALMRRIVTRPEFYRVSRTDANSQHQAGG
ncbi:MAG: DUF1592 domain-containing protein, partial [Rhodospirillaceae bacterium]